MAEEAPLPPAWPYSAAEYCTYLKQMDEWHKTPKDSPLHHDNRCTLMFRS